MYSNQLGDDSFEICSLSARQYNEISGWDKSQSGVVTDEHHDGDRGFRFVFTEGGGSFGIYPGVQWACAERTYEYSLWIKQATADSCTMEVIWGATRNEVILGTHTPTTEWSNIIKDYTITGTGLMIYGNHLEFRVTCAAGGLANPVWIDDLSFLQPDLQ
ncbi:hypothetical protein CC78DRAFT_574574 [Lojkania enalia]|uniref:Uncharacterized protein n=1 Tax=Lojkania enalia TaxID=147567 RepID=A0A9P4TQU5_9PLEO|nr:hypothetical protein CC78DRAFT_574574 [Didymosphaeria enalia]